MVVFVYQLFLRNFQNCEILNRRIKLVASDNQSRCYGRRNKSSNVFKMLQNFSQ